MYIEQCTLSRLQEIAERLGGTLRVGDVIVLSGDVGAGKTTFTRALAKGMGIDQLIQSPSFTIVNNYTRASDGLGLAHYDFYRLHEPGVMANELQESINEAVVVIEWADIVQGVLPDDILMITFDVAGEQERDLTLRASGTRSRELIGALQG